jgi:hypothetical protein
MNLLHRFGFSKSDEMDIHIALSAVRLSWLVVMVALLIWSIYDVATKLTMTLPFDILLLGLLIFFSTDLYLRRKLSSGNRQ